MPFLASTLIALSLSIPAQPPSVIIIGAGVAGLTAARACAKAGVQVQLLEASDGVGGRVRTDRTEDGYLLDRGFQVFIEDYPEARRVLDYEQLQLQRFWPGALVLDGASRAAVSDPLRRPQDTLAALLSPVGTPLDKLILGVLIIRLRGQTFAQALAKDEQSTEDYLFGLGLSASIVDTFFRPFLQVRLGLGYSRGAGRARARAGSRASPCVCVGKYSAWGLGWAEAGRPSTALWRPQHHPPPCTWLQPGYIWLQGVFLAPLAAQSSRMCDPLLQPRARAASHNQAQARSPTLLLQLPPSALPPLTTP